MKFIANISDKTWIFDEEILECFCLDFGIGFIDNESSSVNLEGINFGYILKLNDKKISEDYQPKENISYVSTDQELIDFFRIENLLPDYEYNLNVWAEKNEDRWEKNVSLILPIPNQPYPSWNYNREKGMWFPPTPHPNDGSLHEWDELTMQWIELEIPQY